MTRALLTSAEVARKLGHSLSWFHRARRRLPGFPPPVDGLGLRWDPVAIDLWLDHHLPPGGLADPKLTAAQALEQRRQDEAVGALLDQNAQALAAVPAAIYRRR